jgi:hypothetical protein
MKSLIGDAIDIRGCQFFCTAFREQHLSHVMNEKLNKIGYSCANIPVGVCEYDSQAIVGAGLINSCPSIPKCCGIFRTLGEKRLNTHVLQGLEILLYYLVKSSSIEVDLPSMQAMFPKARHEKDWVDLTFSCLTSDWKYPEHETYTQFISKPVYTDNSYLVNSLESKLVTPSFTTDKEKLLDYCNKQAGIHGDYLKDHIADLLSKDVMNTFATIYANAGYECGQILRVFADEGLNWGSYVDHTPEGHCNAHGNNFVLLMKGPKLLGALDFDIGFLREDFIDISDIKTNELYGKYNEKEFNERINNERLMLEMSLAGGEVATNFMSTQFDYVFNADENKSKAAFLMLQAMYRDTLIYYFRKGFDKIACEIPKIPENGIYRNTLIEMGLIVSDKYIA